MPPRFVRTIEDLIYWEYSILISYVAKGKKIYPFVTDRWKKFKSGEITIGDTTRDILFQIKQEWNKCVYCGSNVDLSFDHIIPISRGGPDNAENQVLSCRSCNSSKGDKDPFEWYGINKKEEIPLLVRSKYFKLLLQFHKKENTLDSNDLNGDGILNVLDFGFIFKKNKMR